MAMFWSLGNAPVHPSHEHRWAPELGKQAEDASLLQHWVDSGINSAAHFGLCHVCEEHRSHKSSPQWLSHKSKPTAAASQAWCWDARTTLLCKAMVASYSSQTALEQLLGCSGLEWGLNYSGAVLGLLWVTLGIARGSQTQSPGETKPLCLPMLQVRSWSNVPNIVPFQLCTSDEVLSLLWLLSHPPAGPTKGWGQSWSPAPPITGDISVPWGSSQAPGS